MPTIYLTTTVEIPELNFKVSESRKAMDMAGTHLTSGVRQIGTSEETIAFADVVPGYVLLRNHDDANVVQVGNATGVYPLELPPGDATGEKGPYVLFAVPSATATLYVKAVTAACDLEYYLIDA